MISKAAASFWQHYEGLPDHIQRLADKNYGLWLANPQHPSLRFKPFKRGDRGGVAFADARAGGSVRHWLAFKFRRRDLRVAGHE